MSETFTEAVEPDVQEQPPVADVPVPVASNASPVASASNESPVLPPSAQVSAARAHAALGHLIGVARTVQADLERYIPQPVLSAAEAEVAATIRGLL